MIELFKKSRFGQIIITAFLSATVVAGVTVWLYESIRIPALSGQLAFREDKIRDLEAQVQKEKDSSKALAIDVESEKLQTATWRRSSELTKEELNQISAKLREAQDEQYKLTQELTALKLNSATFSHTSATNSPAAQANARPAMGFEEAVLSCAEQEDMALLVVDNQLTDLRLVSYANFIQEFDGLRSRSTTVTRADELTPFVTTLVVKAKEYWDFRLALEKLRTHVTKKTLDFYRSKLANFGTPTPTTFAKQIRQKPDVIAEVSELTTGLKSKETSAGWNSNATVRVEAFIASNKLPVGAASPETPSQSP